MGLLCGCCGGVRPSYRSQTKLKLQWLRPGAGDGGIDRCHLQVDACYAFLLPEFSRGLCGRLLTIVRHGRFAGFEGVLRLPGLSR